MAKYEEILARGSNVERVIGTYLFPYALLYAPKANDADSVIEVVKTVHMDGSEILVTRNGGLMRRPPKHFSTPNSGVTERRTDHAEKLKYQENLTRTINAIICEFNLNGIPSEPASPLHICNGHILGNYAMIMGPVVSGEQYSDRSLGPYMGLRGELWRTWRILEAAKVDKILQLTHATVLQRISSALPELVAWACYHFARRQYNESLNTAWIVVEQLINSLWDDHAAQLTLESRRKRMENRQVFTVPVMLEVLQTAGQIDRALGEVLHIAFDHRMKLAQRVKMDAKMCAEVLRGMTSLIGSISKSFIDPLPTSEAVVW